MGDADQRLGRTIVLPVRGSRVRWTRALTGLFMDHLAQTGNIAAAARLIGIDPSSAYHRLRTNAAFAEAWDAAIKAGYQSVETRLIGYVLSGGNAEAAEQEGRPFDWDQALRLLALRERRQSGKAPAGHPPRQVATRDETDRVILAKLAALAASKTKASEGAEP